MKITVHCKKYLQDEKKNTHANTRKAARIKSNLYFSFLFSVNSTSDILSFHEIAKITEMKSVIFGLFFLLFRIFG